MQLNIIGGLFKSGKTSFLYEKIREHSKELSQNCILLVPEQITYQKEKELINYLNEDGIINIQVLSFKRLAYQILEETGGIKISSINDYGKMMLIRNIMISHKDELKIFKKNQQQQGMLKELNKLINELKSSGVSPEFLNSVKANIIDDENLNNKINDVEIVYSNLKKYLENNFIDEEDTLSLCINNICNSELVKNSHIYIDEFENITNTEMLIIKELVKSTNQLFITMVMPFEFHKEQNLIEGYEISGLMLDSLKRISKETNNDIEYTYITNQIERPGDIKHLTENFFENIVECKEGEPSNIQLFCALNPFIEMCRVADNIIKDARLCNYKWKDVAVLIGDEKLLNTSIEKVFSEYGIPYFLDSKRDIMSHPMVVMILSILDINLWNYKIKDVIRFAKCGYTSIDGKNIEELENYALKHGVNGYKWKRKFTYKDTFTESQEINRKYLSDLLEISDDIRKKEKAINKIKYLVGIITDLNIYEKIKKESYILKNNELYEKAYENAQIWNSVMEIFEQIINITGDTELELKEFRDILQTGFEEYSLSIIPPSEDCVIIGTLGRTRINKVKSLYLAGVNEGLMPSQFENKGILYDDERLVLKNKGANIRDTDYNISLENYNLNKIINAVENKITFSYSLGNTEGKSLKPSIYISKIKTIFPNIKISGGITESIDMPEAIKPSFNYISSKIREFLKGKDLSEDDKNLYLWIKNNEKHFIDLIFEAINYENKAFISNRKLLEKLYDYPLNMTPYTVESYNSCPFKFFVENGLKPVPREEYKIEFKEIGNIYHKILEEITKQLISTNDFYNLDEILLKKEINKIAENIIDNEEDDNNPLNDNDRNKHIKSKIQQTAEISALYLIKQLTNGEFRPLFSELGFGINENDLKAIEIDIDDANKLYLKGRIDRVDVCEVNDNTYINIFDYKSSNKSIELNDAINGFQIQLFIYMNALIGHNNEIFENKGSFGGVFYFHINNPLINGDKIGEVDINDEIFKNFSLQGYVIDDLNVVSKIDSDLTLDRKSKIINSIKLNKDNSFGAYSKTLNANQFNKLSEIVENNIKEAAAGVINGNIEINPFKNKTNTPCSFCDFISICQFDDSLTGNEYRKIKNKTDKEILEYLDKGGANLG